MSNAARPGISTALLLILTVGAGSTDAISYLGLGQVFPANMTGNTVLLAIDTTSGKYTSAAHDLLALGGFVLGAAIAGAVTAMSARSPWTRGVLAGLLVELAVLVGALIWWLVLDRDHGGGSKLGPIGLFGAAMGLQSGTVAKLGVEVSTTYLTGTWTQVSTWFAWRLRRRLGNGRVPAPPGRQSLQIGVLSSYFVAAVISGYLYRAAGARAALVPCAAIAAVCVLCRASGRQPRLVDLADGSA